MERFNFAAHIFETNRSRKDKTAYIDDRRSITYGELEDGAKRFAARCGRCSSQSI